MLEQEGGGVTIPRNAQEMTGHGTSSHDLIDSLGFQRLGLMILELFFNTSDFLFKEVWSQLPPKPVAESGAMLSSSCAQHGKYPIPTLPCADPGMLRDRQHQCKVQSVK